MMKDYYTINELATISGASFKFEKHGKNVRLIISGPEDFVLDTINGWYK